MRTFLARDNTTDGVMSDVTEVRFGTRQDGVTPFVLAIFENGAGVLLTLDIDAE